MSSYFFGKFILFTLFICNIILTQNQGDIHIAELMDTKTVDEISAELQSDFSDYDIPLNINFDVSLYRVEYHTIDPHGSPTIASGVLAIPLSQSVARPFFSYQHGTVLKRNSVSSVNGFDIVSMWLGGRGFITAIPDFLGLGVSDMLHPYMVALPSATSVVDMIRAGKNLCDSLNVLISEDVFLAGYSEGGFVTMAAHKYIEEELDGEIEVTASAPCAGPYDLSSVMYNLMLTPQPYGSPNYLPYTILAYNDVYGLYDSPSDFFISPYDTLLPQLFDGTHSGAEVDEIMPEIPIEIVRPDVLEEVTSNPAHPLRTALHENDLYQWIPQSPITLLHSNEDELVPVQNTINAYEFFINNGAENVEIYVENLGSHTEAAAVILLAAAAWLESFINVTQVIELEYGWNMIGLPIFSEDNYVETLFPDALDNSLFMFQNGGYVEDNILNTGIGYWLRFDSQLTTALSGEPIETVSIQLETGWNLISGISESIFILDIVNDLIIDGSIFGFDGYYAEAQTIEPGNAYWLRSVGNGELILPGGR